MKKTKMLCAITSALMAVLFVVLSVSAPVGALSTVATANEDKIDSALKEKMATASPDEVIPIYIWYSDINHTEVESEVKKTTNLSLDNISVDFQMPSTSLINDYKNNVSSADAKMEAYFEETKEFRKAEKDNTDTYISAKRAVSAKKYKEKSNTLINECDIKENVIFNSQYAPMMIAELTMNEINDLVKDARVQEVSLIKNTDIQSFGTAHARQTLNQVKVQNLLGLTGDGVDVGIFEAEGHPAIDGKELLESDVIKLGSSNEGQDHATNVATIIAGNTNGFAPDSKIYSVYVNNVGVQSPYREQRIYSNLETLLSYDVKVINCSTGWGRNYSDDMYLIREKWYDHITSYHHVTFVTAAGNDGLGTGLIADNAMGYNSITVGAYDDQYTVSKTDDRMGAASSFSNINSLTDTSTNTTTYKYGIEKPDVVLPGNYNYIVDDSVTSFTSYATPILTGSIALLFELKPSLAAYPQAVKAIVLASCHRKVLPTEVHNEPVETMEQGITEHQGAGVPDIWTMACIVCQGSYGIGVIEAAETSDSHNFYIPGYGADNMNVSITWLREVVRDQEGSMEVNTCNIGEYVNLDLSVYRGTSTIPVGTSAKTLSSTEMTYFELDDNEYNYKFEITKPVSNSAVRYGYAFSTDKAYAASLTRGGIFRYKNLETKKYLTVHPETNQITLQNYSNTTAQQWIIKPTAFTITSAHNNLTGGITIGSSISAKNKSIVFSNTPTNLTRFILSTDPDYNYGYGYHGADIWQTYVGGTNYKLGCYNNTPVVTSESTINKSMLWVTERCFYRNGDSNADGVISIKDASKITHYLSNTDTMTSIEMYLADVDLDGIITQSDAERIQNIIVGNAIY